MHSLLTLLLAAAALAAFGSASAQTAGESTDPWFHEVVESLDSAEYSFSVRPDGTWSAPNRAQGLRTRLGEGGFEVVSRTAGEQGFRFALELSGYGRRGALQPAEAGLVVADGGRAELDRGAVTEWWVNTPAGLEHGFTVRTPPVSGDGPLALEMRLGGTLSAFPDGSRNVSLRDPAGVPVLRYAGLAAWDARGETLEASFAYAPGAILIEVDDRHAVYPIVVDPLTTAAEWSLQENQASAMLGAAVAPAGDVDGDGYSDVIVGAPLYDGGLSDEGAAFLYLGSAGGLSAVASWSAEGDQADAHFGVAVGSAGDVDGDGFADLIVGADLFDNGQTDEGRAFVFHGSASGPSATADWTAENDQAGSLLGGAVGTAGDVNGDGYADVIVGAELLKNPQKDEGGTYVYHGSAAGLSATPDWTAEGDQAKARFGGAVGTAGDVNGDGYADVIVGADGYSNGNTEEGAAFVFLGSASGLGGSAAWSAESAQDNAHLGTAVGTAGDVDGDGYADVIVGAADFDNVEIDEGRAFVYLGSSTGPAASPAWTAEPDQAGARFGIAVGTAGDLDGDGYADVIVGASQYDNVEVDEGAAYVYPGSAAGPATTSTWMVESDQADAHMGVTVGTAGDVNGDGYSDVLVGADLYDDGETDEGRVFVYRGSAAGATTTSSWSASGQVARDQFGYAVAPAGDVNGDGYDDVIVGARLFDNGELNEGAAFLYLGSPSGLSSTHDWMGESDQADARYGVSVGTAGDVNGDGYADIAVGATRFANPDVDEGRVFVYHGSPAGPSATADWTAEADQPDAFFGLWVATAGDVNGDGYADLAVGAYVFDDGETDEGAAFVYHGSPSGLSILPDWSAYGDQPAAWFGTVATSAGDVNGDGFSDVIVGARHFDNGEIDEGAAFVYHGSATGLSPTADWMVEADQADAEFGRAVATAGDINGDGYSDVIVGAERFDAGEIDEGRAFVYHGSAGGLSATADWTGEGGQAGARYGNAIGTAGDVNGDGYGDVLVAANRFDNGEQDEGQVYIYLGSATGLGLTPGWTTESDQGRAEYGHALALAGDVNGDGFSDVVIGAPLWNDAPTDIGRAWVYHGAAGGGLSRIPRQARAAGDAPIGVLGESDSVDSFRLRPLGRTAAGRGLVAMQFEVQPLGSPFDPASVQTTSPVSTGAPGADGSAHAFDTQVSGLSSGALKWRLRFTSSDPYFPGSRWISLSGNAQNETDLRICSTKTWYEDIDGDRHGNPGVTQVSCPRPLGFVSVGDDCDDGDIARFPGNPELCDGVDNDCNDVVDDAIPPADAVEDLTLAKVAGNTDLAWDATASATLYDIVRGNLMTLRASAGDFAQATDSCVADDAVTTSAQDPEDPQPFDGFWYLVRPGNCGGVGSYDTGLPSQLASRDGGIAASGVGCP